MSHTPDKRKIRSAQVYSSQSRYRRGICGTSVNLVLTNLGNFCLAQEWILGVGVRALEHILEFTMADRLFVAIPALQLIPVFQYPIHLPLAEERVNAPNTRICL